MRSRPSRLRLLGAGLLALAGCGGAGHATTTAAIAPGTTSSAAAPPAHHRAHHHRRPHRHLPNPGRLPQTMELPSASTPAFSREMAALWRGIRTGNPDAAVAAFFPEAAYEQVKAIANPSVDFVDRLLGEYRLDIAAAHALLGTHPRRARLIDVIVERTFAHWVPPGACYNRVGYYEVPNSRVVYRQAGTVHSFGIASMISWRGVWYVVHLGAILRPGPGGAVDAPSAGPGAPVPSSTC